MAVEPVRDIRQFKIIEAELYKHYGEQYADLWAIGLNVALRIGDLLSITMADAALALDRGYLGIKEQKTGKLRDIKLNTTAKARIQQRLSSCPSDIYLFQAHSNNLRGRTKALSRQVVYAAFRKVGDSMGLKMGTHTMRKSLGYAMHSAGSPIELIARTLNHSNPAVTMAYIGLNKQAVDDAMDKFEIQL
jgi:integrase